MKVLVATKEFQGARGSDFSWTDEGELVGIPFECDRDRRENDIDGKCGCMRSFSGFNTRRATTTAKVVERKMTKKEMRTAFAQSMQKSGWNLPKIEIDCEVDELLRVAAAFPVGSIVEKRGDVFNMRRLTQAGA